MRVTNQVLLAWHRGRATFALKGSRSCSVRVIAPVRAGVKKLTAALGYCTGGYLGIPHARGSLNGLTVSTPPEGVVSVPPVSDWQETTKSLRFHPLWYILTYTCPPSHKWVAFEGVAPQNARHWRHDLSGQIQLDGARDPTCLRIQRRSAPTVDPGFAGRYPSDCRKASRLLRRQYYQ